jgi:hypothetical protein
MGNPFSQNQLTFAANFIGASGLSGAVVMGWMAGEEPPGANQTEYNNNQDWLNVGGPGARAGASSNLWNDPATAGQNTWSWIIGKLSVPGFGTAAASIQSIIPGAVGKSDNAQALAIDQSGWLPGGYNNLTALIAQYGQYAPSGTTDKATKGGVAGLGGTGTVVDGSAATTYPFQIGGTANPDEDYWTGINRLAQEVNWYLFTNGEMLYYMDGSEVIAQTPALTIDRITDSARFASPVQLNWDNTAFLYVSTHKRRFRVQRKTKLTQITSPTQVRLDLICGIDEIRAGDVIVLTSFGPGDGAWIVGDCTRSVFSVSSQITLVPPIAPITEAAVAGTTGKASQTTTFLEHGGSGGAKSGFTNPFPSGWVPGRLDAGYDGTFTKQIVAPFSGTITFAATSFANWGGYIQLKADGGTIAGLETDTLYFAEGVAPVHTTGTHVNVGDPIGNAYTTGAQAGVAGNIEWGPAQPGRVGAPTDVLIHAVSDPAAMVIAFSQWAQKTLGLPPPASTDHAGFE